MITIPTGKKQTSWLFTRITEIRNSWWCHSGFCRKPDHQRRQFSGCQPAAPRAEWCRLHPQAPRWPCTWPSGQCVLRSHSEGLGTCSGGGFSSKGRFFSKSAACKACGEGCLFCWNSGPANVHPENIRGHGWVPLPIPTGGGGRNRVIVRNFHSSLYPLP